MQLLIEAINESTHKRRYSRDELTAAIDRYATKKSAAGQKSFTWEESKHPRDEKGQFAEKESRNSSIESSTFRAEINNNAVVHSSKTSHKILEGIINPKNPDYQGQLPTKEAVTNEIRVELKKEVQGVLAKKLGGNKDWQEYIDGNLKWRAEQNEEEVDRSPEAFEKMSREMIHNLVGQWAESSGDHHVISVALQRAVEEEFGLERYGKFWEADPDDHAAFNSGMGSVIKQTNDLYEKDGAGYRAFLRAQYDATQEWFKSHGITEVALYRGFAFTSKAPESVQETGLGQEKIGIAEVEFQQQPASSFSLDPEIAKEFSTRYGGQEGTSVLLGATVPVERILSTPRTGFGCLPESECVVLSSPGSRGNAIIGSPQEMQKLNPYDIESGMVVDSSGYHNFERKLQDVAFEKQHDRKMKGYRAEFRLMQQMLGITPNVSDRRRQEIIDSPEYANTINSLISKMEQKHPEHHEFQNRKAAEQRYEEEKAFEETDLEFDDWFKSEWPKWKVRDFFVSY